MFSDIYVQFLSEGFLEDKNLNLSLMHVNFQNLTSNIVLPALLQILQDQDPLPLYSVKLMTLMSEGTSLIITTIFNIDRFQSLLALYDVTNPKFNHCIFKLIQSFLESSCCNLKDFNQFFFIQKTAHMALKFSKGKQDWIFNQIIDLVLAYSNKLFMFLTDNSQNLVKI